MRPRIVVTLGSLRTTIPLLFFAGTMVLKLQVAPPLPPLEHRRCLARRRAPTCHSSSASLDKDTLGLAPLLPNSLGDRGGEDHG